MKRVMVIGGGAAGMMAAVAAAEAGARVWLWEKNNKLGRKLALTGKGRCNLTTAVAKEDLLKGYLHNGRFLYSAFHAYSNNDVVAFFHAHGLATKVERGQRVFPYSDKAQDVVDVLHRVLQERQIHIMFSSPVTGISVDQGQAGQVQTAEGSFTADAVIVCTGGLSYPGTGSTGDGYGWAAASGHRVIEPKPGLVPLMAEDPWIADLKGLSLKNVKAAAYTQAGKKINSEFGEMLFTHFGVSGPIILSMSNAVGEQLDKTGEPVKLCLDMKPALSAEKLDRRLWRDLQKNANKQLKNALYDLLPKRLIPVVLQRLALDGDCVCHQVSRGQRLALVDLLKNFPVTITGTRPIAEAIVTVGGVNVKDIEPKTMESKLVKGLFFAGEVLDVDGYTGGYNLQAAFSTGYLAGKNAAGR